MITFWPWHVCVLIPARNEEELIGRCLVSVLAAKAELRGLASVDIAVVADCSTDTTIAIARKLIGSHGTVLTSNAGRVGLARRLAARFALARYEGHLERCWLANTDADCILPSHWLSRQLRMAEKGIQALAGTVAVDNFKEHGPEVSMRFKSSYRIEADGSHPHVHGANLGVRADMYIRAGEWPGLATAEDHDLWGRLQRIGAMTCSSNSIEVITSGRRQGRAPQGFADALAAHN